MSLKMTGREAFFTATAVAALAGLLCSAWFLWREVRVYTEKRAEAVLYGEASMDADEIRVQQVEWNQRNRNAGLRIAQLQATLAELHKKFGPVEPQNQRQVQLELLNLAERHGLQVDEVSIVEGPTEVQADVAAEERPVAGGDEKQKRSLSLKCRATFRQASSFLNELAGMRMVLIPVAFSLNQNPAGRVSAAAEALDDAPAATPTVLDQACFAEARLRFDVTIGF